MTYMSGAWLRGEFNLQDWKIDGLNWPSLLSPRDLVTERVTWHANGSPKREAKEAAQTGFSHRKRQNTAIN